MATNKLLDGKALARELRAKMAADVKTTVARGVRPPGLAVILAGDDPASKVYVRNKEKACQEAGITSLPFILENVKDTGALLSLIDSLNQREDVDGILLQLPLPYGLDVRKCLDAIDPAKDVDGFHPLNMGKLALGLPGFIPCTPQGVLELLRHNDISLAGKKAVIVGRSDIVGKPLAMLLTQKGVDATVTICHSGTHDLKKECLESDLLFAAIGKAGAITADMVPKGCVVVDIGINRTEKGICGDVDFAGVSAKAAAITPVPGGIGPMTIAMLLRNTIAAWKKRLEPGEG